MFARLGKIFAGSGGKLTHYNTQLILAYRERARCPWSVNSGTAGQKYVSANGLQSNPGQYGCRIYLVCDGDGIWRIDGM